MTCRYSECDGSGFIASVVKDEFRGTQYRAYRECRCKRQDWLEKQFSGNVSERVRANRFENFNRESMGDQANTVESWANSTGGRWLYLAGPVGTGKTHLAAAAANRFVERGFDCIMVTVPDVLDRLRPGNDSDSELFKTLEAVTVLILDDFCAQRNTEWVNEVLFRLINSRYNSRKVTAFTSNVQLGTLRQEAQWARVADRILECSIALTMAGESYRVRLAKAANLSV